MLGLGWLAGAVCGVLLVTGCSAEQPAVAPKRPTAPSTSPVATTSPEPTPTPPALPASARKDTKAGAVAFAKHYVALINFTSKTGDSQALLRASASGCAVCRDINGFVEGVYKHGGYIEGGAWEPTSYSVIRRERGRWLVSIQIHADKQLYRLSEHSPVRHRTGGDYTVSISTAWRGQAWRLEKLASAQ